MKTLPRSSLWIACWWLIWGCLLVQQVILHPWHWHGSWLNDNPSFTRLAFSGILSPLVMSVVLRWLILPTVSSTVVAFLVFVSGMMLAAMSGIIVTSLDVPYKQVTFILCVAGIVEYVPIRIGRAMNESNQHLSTTAQAKSGDGEASSQR